MKEIQRYFDEAHNPTANPKQQKINQKLNKMKKAMLQSLSQFFLLIYLEKDFNFY